jgi:uncharacterized protein YceK
MRPLAAALFVVWATLSGCASFKAWDREDRALYAFNLGCHAIDYAQTSWAIEHGYVEANPLLGESPSNDRLAASKLAAGALTWWVADSASDDRTRTLLTMTGACLAVLAHNHSEGARPW